MRRLFVLIGLLAALALPAPAAAHVPTHPCSVSVDPSRGSRSDVYRITGTHFPLPVSGPSLEVQIDIMRVVFDDNGERLEIKSIMWLSLIPGGHTFYVDYPDQAEGATRLKPGHYVVGVETPHQKGCRTVTGFDVVRR
ncbi:MAG: hypothetical protein QFC55_06900 [Chloroflexota bacterium]|nr:hypothetical protein [Chloroflexota bacterium]